MKIWEFNPGHLPFWIGSFMEKCLFNGGDFTRKIGVLYMRVYPQVIIRYFFLDSFHELSSIYRPFKLWGIYLSVYGKKTKHNDVYGVYTSVYGVYTSVYMDIFHIRDKKRTNMMILSINLVILHGISGAFWAHLVSETGGESKTHHPVGLHLSSFTFFHLVVGWATPLKNMTSSIGMMTATQY